MYFDWPGDSVIQILHIYSGIGISFGCPVDRSDTAKFLEAVCYSLVKREDAELRACVEEQVKWIRTSQWDDGYINSFFTLIEPQNRFTNLRLYFEMCSLMNRDAHELYCAGHLLEAAIAHYQLTQKTYFLNAMLKYVALIQSTFGSEEYQLHGYPGHEELELALMKLYRITNAQEHLNLARYFIEERGQRRNGEHYYEIEAKRNGVTLWPGHFKQECWFEYMQAGQPIREQTSIEGIPILKLSNDRTCCASNVFSMWCV